MSDWDFLWGLSGDDLDFAVMNGYTKEEFLTKISDKFTIETGDAAVEPEQKGETRT